MPTGQPRPQRRSIRLPGYDYRQTGAYVVTIYTERRRLLFGEVVAGIMHMNEAGAMIEHVWRGIAERLSAVELDAFVVMPNHVYGIVVLRQPDDESTAPPGSVSLADVIGWFKTMTTNAYIRGVPTNGWARFDGRLWQRNYYEHIVRDEGALERHQRYILDNPGKWSEDRENPDRVAGVR